MCRPEIHSVGQSNEGTMHMIVIGVDAHKRTHTLVAVDAGTGEMRGQRTVPSGDGGSIEAMRFVQGWMMSGCGRSRIAATCPGAWSER